jgi:hypothetical protein
MESSACPIWGTPAKPIQTGRYGDYVQVDSPRIGGAIKVTGTAVTMITNLTESQKRDLTNWIIEQRKQGELCPEVGSDLVSRIKSGFRIVRTPSERYDSLLSYLESSVEALGSPIKYAGAVDEEVIRRKQELLAYTGSIKDSEAVFLINQAERAGHVEKVDLGLIRLTLDGYSYVISLRTKSPDSKQAFVAMWFDASMTEIYENGIELAIAEAGYKAMRIDRKEHSNKVDDEIIGEIRRSRFVVADFTSERDRPRGGVYFEAGFAQGLNLPVIWTCRIDLIDQLHFDTRQFNHIVWKEAADLRLALRNRIVAVVGPGPLQSLP